MDELSGDQATWRFDGESIAIRYEPGGRSKGPLFRRISQLEVPVGVIASVDFRPRALRRRGWALELRLRPRTDPYAEVGSALRDDAQPFRITGPAASELVAEYLADQVVFAAGRKTDEPDPATALRFVPPLPLHVQTAEGTATLDKDGLRLVWAGSEASGRKKEAQRRGYPLADITGAEWVPSDGWERGYMRVSTADSGEQSARPKHDLYTLVAANREQERAALVMAAAVTAHVWARGGPDRPLTGRAGVASRGWLDVARSAVVQFGADAPDPEEPPKPTERAPADTAWIFEQIERLGDLHTKGLLTDEEFSAKKAELLDRI